MTDNQLPQAEYFECSLILAKLVSSSTFAKIYIHQFLKLLSFYKLYDKSGVI